MSQTHQMPDQQMLRQFFQKVDRDGSGSINCHELQSALSNGTFDPFNIDTVRLLITMFDTNGSGSINFDEFTRLWKYITDWLNCFQSFDLDRSGFIDRHELNRALTSFGYRFSDQFYETLLLKFKQRSLTAEFRKLDTDLDGVITIPYEQFVSLVFKIVINK